MNTPMIAITRTSGSGKSTVSKLYRNWGYEVCDADIVARQVLEKGSNCLVKLVEQFGKDILDEQGNLRRRLLADRAFATSKGTEILTEITHPEIIRRIVAQWQNTKSSLFFVDGAVIVGHPLQKMCSKIIVVQTSPQIAVERICQRDGISAEMAERRLKAQISQEELEKAADYIIWNNSHPTALEQQAKTVLQRLTEEDFL